LSQINEETKYEMAKIDPRWHKTMNEEFHALKKIILGKYVSYPKIKNQLVASEFIKLNIIIIIL
jgi:hypothetical protein